MQNALNLNRDPANGFDLDTSDAGALLPSLTTTVADVITILRDGLGALSFPKGAIILTGSLLLLYNRG